MSPFQTFILILLGGVTLTSLTIVFLFILIHVCIQRKAAEFNIRSELNDCTSRSNIKRTQTAPESEAPPLPSRDQFLSQGSDSHSYEDVPNSLDYLKVEEETQDQTPDVLFLSTMAKHQDQISTSENYDDVAELEHNVFKSCGDLTSLPDYVELEENTPPAPPDFLLQPFCLADQSQCQDSQNDWDFYADFSEEEDGEDYDDVG